MKQLTAEQLAVICNYYELEYNQGEQRPYLEDAELGCIEFWWSWDFNLRVHCNHDNGKDIQDISSMYFVDGDGEKYKIPSLIFKSIAYYITAWSNA
jgi:hypothetical protein